MNTKRVVARAIVGAALTATLIGGSAVVAGAIEGHPAHRAAGATASGESVASVATLVEPRGRLDAERPAATAIVDAAPQGAATDASAGAGGGGAGPATSGAKKDDHAGQAGPDRCQDWQLIMDYRERPDLSTSEVLGFEVVFANAWSQPCSFDGWPGLVAEDADGARLGWALATGSTSTRVVLPPNGGQAVAVGSAALPAAVGCASATSDRLRAYITSDGAGDGVVADAQLPVCIDGTFSLWLGPLEPFHGAPAEVGEVMPPEEPAPLPAKCQDEQLTLEYLARPDLSVDAASGFQLAFTNATDTACAIWGWPGLVVESADGTRIGSSWTTGEMTDPFVLEQGDVAIVLGTAPDPVAWGCDVITADHLRAYVTSDGAGPGVVATAPIPVCADGSTVLEIGPITPA